MSIPSVKVPVKYVGLQEDLKYANPDDAGFDLRVLKTVKLSPGEKQLVPCGFRMAIPSTFKGFGLMGMIVPRSSSGKLDVMLANTVGIIDSCYRGDIMIYVRNNSQLDTVVLESGQRVAQMMLVPYVKGIFVESETLPDSARGTGGFGSTGTK